MRFLFKIGMLAIMLSTSAMAEMNWPDNKSIHEAQRRTQEAFDQMPLLSSSKIKQSSGDSAFQTAPTKPTGIDIGQIADQYKHFQAPTTFPRQTRLLAFVSLSMPKESLQHLAEDAARANAVLVLRGFINDSLQKTLRAIKAILGDKGRAAWEIDPTAFTRYGVTVVPTYVLARHADNRPEDFMAVQGDVSLGYALDVMAKQRPGFGAQVHEFRQRLGGGD